MLKALRWKAVPRWLMVTKWCDLRVLRVHPARSGRRFVGWAKRSVPTIQDKLNDRWWARCALPTLRTANWFALRATAIATNQHDGKSLLIFRNRVKPKNQKYSA